MNQESHLALHNIQKSYKNKLLGKRGIILKNINCHFPQGSTSVILGRNGAGKTTLLRLILGYLLKDHGIINYFGKELTAKHRRKIGYVAEKNILPILLNPMELFKHQHRLMQNKSTHEFVEPFLQKMQLWDHRFNKIKTLSKGMQRRLAWGLATLHRPELLILDEPFSGLDPIGRKEMQNWLQQEREMGKTIILSTHEILYLPTFLDFVHVFKKGEIVKSCSHLPSEREIINFLAD